MAPQRPSNYIYKRGKVMGRTTKREDRYKVSRTNLHSMEDNIEDRTTFFYHAFRNILLVSVPLLLISALILSLPHSSAVSSDASGTDNVQLVLSTSCTVNAVVTSEHSVSLNGGQLDNNVGNTKLSAFCNDNNGYSIYAVGSSGDIDGNTDLVNTINEGYNIHTGIYDDTAQTNPSSWAMKLTAGTGTGIDPVTGESVPTTPPTIVNGYDSYSAIPNVYTQIAKRTSGTSMTTDTSVSGSYLNTTYQIYANSAQPSGTYTGKVKYLMVHPHSDASITNIDTAFARVGKTKVYSVKNGNYYYAMQDMTTDICSLVTGDGDFTSAQLVDNRDGNIYWVTKLKDGHCWMTQNLDFDIVADAQDPTKMKTLTSEDTDLTDHSLTGAYSGGNGYSYDENTGITSWTPASSAKTINFTGTTVTDWQNSNIGPYSANKTDDTGTGHSSPGNYYNWTAAIASNNSNTLTNDTLNNIQNNPQNSICPKGWRLPTISNQSGSGIGSTNEFARLNYLYNNNKTDTYIGLIESPLYFSTPGIISPFEEKGTGRYYSSTVGRSSNAYSIYISSNSLNLVLASGYGRGKGFSIRCVAR